MGFSVVFSQLKLVANASTKDALSAWSYTATPKPKKKFISIIHLSIFHVTWKELNNKAFDNSSSPFHEIRGH